MSSSNNCIINFYNCIIKHDGKIYYQTRQGKDSNRAVRSESIIILIEQSLI